jgi:hypothetical protein
MRDPRANFGDPRAEARSDPRADPRSGEYLTWCLHDFAWLKKVKIFVYRLYPIY